MPKAAYYQEGDIAKESKRKKTEKARREDYKERKGLQKENLFNLK